MGRLVDIQKALKPLKNSEKNEILEIGIQHLLVNWLSWPIGIDRWHQQTSGTDGCHWKFGLVNLTLYAEMYVWGRI